MKKKPLRQILLEHLKGKQGNWIHSGDLEKVSQAWGYKAETGGRALRKLAENGAIQKSKHNGSTIYRYSKTTGSKSANEILLEWKESQTQKPPENQSLF